MDNEFVRLAQELIKRARERDVELLTLASGSAETQDTLSVLMPEYAAADKTMESALAEAKNIVKQDDESAQYLKEQVLGEVALLEDEKGYYAAFSYTYCRACEVRLKLTQLFGDGILSDAEYCDACARVSLAKTKMIRTIRSWIAKRLQESKSELTREQVVFSVFDVLFNEI